MDKYMELAFTLARNTDPKPNPRVGAVLVKDNQIIGQGFHEGPGEPHAEINAIADAKNNKQEVEGSTLYVSLEPCSHTNKRTPPCTNAIISNGIAKVVFGASDPNPQVLGSKILTNAGLEVSGPVAEEEGKLLNKDYLENLSKKPTVAIKMAMTADGKTATKSGDSKWISGEDSRKYVHKLRSEFDAVMVGSRTVIADDPKLTSRIPNGKNPYRVIIDSKLSIPLDSAILNFEDGKTILVCSTQAPKEKKEALASKNILLWFCGEEKVDLSQLLVALSAFGIKKILLEGGSELNSHAIKAKIVDKFYLFIAPKLIGGSSAKGLIGELGIDTMDDALTLKNMKYSQVGEDLLLELDLAY